jgi:hypothetical protein
MLSRRTRSAPRTDDAESEAVALTATNDALDRGGRIVGVATIEALFDVSARRGVRPAEGNAVGNGVNDDAVVPLARAGRGL